MPKENKQPEYKKVMSIGLDLSLVGTGLVLLEDDKVIVQKLIKSKPSGDRPTDELKRIRGIVEEIELVVGEYRPDVAIIENLAFAVRSTTSLTQLAGLFYLVSPPSLKKFATGKGNSEKDIMVLEAFKQLQMDGIDNNIADAAFLSKIGSALLGCYKLTEDYQKETVELLKKQQI